MALNAALVLNVPCAASAGRSVQRSGAVSPAANLACTRTIPSRLFSRTTPRTRTMIVRNAVEVAAAPAKVEIVDGKMGKSLVVDRSYTYLDVRTPEEHKEEASKRKPAIVNVPIGVLTASGPALNKDFVAQVAAKFPNKAARILVACDDEMDRATLAAKKLIKEGYSSIRVLEGGYPEWQKVKPLTEREKSGR